MTRVSKFCIFKDAAGQWRVHLKAGNGEIVFQGEGHPTKQKAVRAAETMKRCAAEACIVVDEPAGKPAIKQAGKPAIKMPAGKPMTKRVLPKPAGKPMTK